MRKSFLVIGMGRFGTSVAEELLRLGNDVMAVDRDENIINDIQDRIPSCAVLDCTDENALRALGPEDFDAAVIGIATDIESSIFTSFILRELGVKYIVAKANNDIHAEILKKLGVNKVILPEYDMALRTASQLTYPGFEDLMKISRDFGIVELVCPEKWAGSSLRVLGLNKKYNIQLVAAKREGRLIAPLDGDFVLLSSDTILVLGATEVISKLADGK